MSGRKSETDFLGIALLFSGHGIVMYAVTSCSTRVRNSQYREDIPGVDSDESIDC